MSVSRQIRSGKLLGQRMAKFCSFKCGPVRAKSILSPSPTAPGPPKFKWNDKERGQVHSSPVSARPICGSFGKRDAFERGRAAWDADADQVNWLKQLGPKDLRPESASGTEWVNERVNEWMSECVTEGLSPKGKIPQIKDVWNGSCNAKQGCSKGDVAFWSRVSAFGCESSNRPFSRREG